MTILDIALITQLTLLTAGICTFIEDRRVRHRRREQLDLSKHIIVGLLVGLIWVLCNDVAVPALAKDYVAVAVTLITGLSNGLIAGFLSRSSLALISSHRK